MTLGCYGNADNACDRLTTLPHLSVYHCREGLMEQSCIRRTVESRHLKLSKPAAVTQQKGSKVDIEQSSLVLTIFIYARTVRGMWAKERAQELAGRGTTTMDDAESETSSIASKENEDQKSKKGEKGLYGPLQLVQKMEILSTSTLQELRESILCRMDDLPESIQGLKGTVQYSGDKRSTDSCFQIEDELYSEESGQGRYAALLEKSLSAKASPAKMKDVHLHSLSICTGKLYWFLHQGNCEHLWTITSIRAMNKGDSENGAFPRTSFFACASAVHPLAKWAQSKNGGLKLAYTLDKCEMCKGNRATMILAGGSRFQSNPPMVISGLKQDTTCICQVCWSALQGKRPASVEESIQRAGLPLPLQASTPTYTLIPAIE